MPFTPPSVTGFNANPPEDDGSAVPSNEVEWQKHLDKIGSPLKTALEALMTELSRYISANFDGEIATAAIQNSAITTAKINDLAVTAAKIAAATITFAKLASAAIASQADAQTGTASSVLMTPERATDHFNARQTSDAEVTSEANVTEFIAPDQLQHSQRVAKAWGYVTISGGTPTLADSFKVTSITDVGTGDFTVNLAVTMGNANYAVAANASTGSNKTNTAMVHTRTTTAFSIKIRDHTNTDIDPDSFSFVVFGD
jgi:hypothetical protein